MNRQKLHVTRYGLHGKRGQAMIVATMFLLSIAVSVMLGTSVPVLRQGRVAEHFINSRQSYLTSESGLEDVLYRIKNGKQVSSTESLSVGSSTATTTVTDAGINEKEISVLGNASDRIRKSAASVTVASGASFNYGVQVGEGGLEMDNNSSVVGNVYSNGPVEGENSNLIKGDVVSAGPSGVIDHVHATSSAYAHSLRHSQIDKDAYYQLIHSTTVLGRSYPDSPDLPKQDMPIADGLISQWETDAAGGGTISSPCPYEIDNDITIGPVKINCNLEISGDPTVTLNGPVWVKGNITIKNSPVIKVASSLGKKSVALIADNTSNRTTSSKISSDNTATFRGSGSGGSYVLLLSQNNSAETGGYEIAVNIANSASGDLLIYAGHGKVLLQNNIKLKEVTAYKVHIKNSAEITYETGLANLLFTSGPSGSWSIEGWKEQ